MLRRIFNPVSVMLAGLFVMLAPTAIFFFMAALPALFSENTVVFWHLLSALGIVWYAPLGLALVVVGMVWRISEGVLGR